jgi:hypothetical protein
MSAKYYVAIRPQTNDNHAVHKEGCPFLPDQKKRIYLGVFNSGQDAIKEGQRHFLKTKSCLFCQKDNKEHAEHPGYYIPFKRGIIPAELQMASWYNQNLFTCIN